MNKRRGTGVAAFVQSRGRGLGVSAGGSSGTAGADSGTVPAAIIKQSRKSGQLNLSNRSLSEVPSCVWRINLDTPDEGKTSSIENPDDRWWEQVDLNKLILASNLLSALSADIQLLPALTVLDVHDNRLSTLPESLSELKNLQRLNVSHNLLQSLPACLGNLSELQVLHAQHNHIQQLPDNIGLLDRLEDLDLSMNQISILPTCVDGLRRLMKLNVANNILKTLPHQLGLISSLRTLEATHNQLHTLPDELGLLVHLECLYLRHNNLTHLPHLHSCSNLKELHVGNNELVSFDTLNTSCLPNLTVLDLRDNRLSRLPDEMGLLQSLQRLDVTNNDLSTLPNVLGAIESLKAIVLDGNPMKAIRRDIVMRGTSELKKYLVSRIQSGEVLPQVKQAAFMDTTGTSGVIGGGDGSGVGIDRHKLSSTRSLEYVDKKVNSLPDDIWQAAESGGVTSVDLSKNSFSDLPLGVVRLRKTLTELHLSLNKISRLNPDVSLLDKLMMIDLSNNQLSELPAQMSSLQCLRECIISFNRFLLVPAVLYKLKRLEIILASDNKISEIDADGLCSLPMIATLDLRNNSITSVPPVLGNCTQLRSCHLEGNLFKQPRISTLAQGTVAILEYLRSRIPA